MPPTIHLLRHGEGFHDLPPQARNSQIHDPELTPHGRVQCLLFRDAFAGHASLSLICASPLRRALQTAQLCFEPALGTSAPPKILALPDAQECTDAPSDRGHPTEWLETQFGESVDFSECARNPYWWRKVGRFEYAGPALRERARRLRRWLRDRPEGHVALVSHGFFLHYVTGDIDEEGKQTGDYWLNTQHRELRFRSEDDDDAALVETPRSVAARKES